MWVSDDLDTVSAEPADATARDVIHRHAIVSAHGRDDGDTADFDADSGSIPDNAVYAASQQRFSSSSSICGTG